MLCEVPLNKEQQAFAADHHGLVYKFLNENRLPEDEFYDVTNGVNAGLCAFRYVEGGAES